MFFNSKSIANNQKNSTEVNIKKLVKNRIRHEYTKISITHTPEKTVQKLIIKSFSSHSGNISALTWP